MPKLPVPFLGLVNMSSPKNHGPGYARVAEDCVVYEGVLEPRHGQVYLGVQNSTSFNQDNAKGIHAVILTNARRPALLILGNFSASADALLIHRGRRCMRAP